ncbi:MAG: YgaP family membrane protein [Parvularcula sp.]
MRFANMGSTDRIIRLLVGLGLLAYVFFIGHVDISTPLGIGMLVVGVMMTVTSFIAFCPVYPLLGIRTRKD